MSSGSEIAPIEYGSLDAMPLLWHSENVHQGDQGGDEAVPDQKQPLRWSRESQTWVPSGDRIFGKVSWDEKKGIVLDINGVLLAMEDFQRTLGVYEGWFFEVKFFDAADIEAPPPSGRM